MSKFDPTATRLPKYESLDRQPYKPGTSPEGSEDIDRHMSAEEWIWEQKLPELVSPQRTEQWMSEAAEALAGQVKQKMDRLE